MCMPAGISRCELHVHGAMHDSTSGPCKTGTSCTGPCMTALYRSMQGISCMGPCITALQVTACSHRGKRACEPHAVHATSTTSAPLGFCHVFVWVQGTHAPGGQPLPLYLGFDYKPANLLQVDDMYSRLLLAKPFGNRDAKKRYSNGEASWGSGAACSSVFVFLFVFRAGSATAGTSSGRWTMMSSARPACCN